MRVRLPTQDTTVVVLCARRRLRWMGAEVDLEWYTQHGSKRFIVKLRGYLNRALTGMITFEGDPQPVDLWLCDCGLEHGNSRGKTAPWDKPALSAKNPIAIAYLPADQARSLHEKLVHCIGSTRRSGREQRNQQDKRRGRSGATATAHALQDRRTR